MNTHPRFQTYFGLASIKRRHTLPQANLVRDFLRGFRVVTGYNLNFNTGFAGGLNSSRHFITNRIGYGRKA